MRPRLRHKAGEADDPSRSDPRDKNTPARSDLSTRYYRFVAFGAALFLGVTLYVVRTSAANTTLAGSNRLSHTPLAAHAIFSATVVTIQTASGKYLEQSVADRTISAQQERFEPSRHRFVLEKQFAGFVCDGCDVGCSTLTAAWTDGLCRFGLNNSVIAPLTSMLSQMLRLCGLVGRIEVSGRE